MLGIGAGDIPVYYAVSRIVYRLKLYTNQEEENVGRPLMTGECSGKGEEAVTSYATHWLGYTVGKKVSNNNVQCSTQNFQSKISM